jgi:hypothetical protein
MSESTELPVSGQKSPKDSASSGALARPEQRMHPRFKVEGATAILGKGRLLLSLGLGPRKSAVVNLSQGGVLVKSTKSFPVETRLRVRIEIPKPEDVLECDGEVRWCAQSAKNDACFYVGIRFERLDPLLEKKIGQMREWFTSVEFRAKASARKEASSSLMKAVRP